MTHFAKPSGASADGYVAKAPLGLSLVRVPV
jgi:hypothetical protein